VAKLLVKLAIVILAGWIFISIFSGSDEAGASEVTLRVHHFLGDDSLPHTGLIVPWAKRVEALSDGRIKVKIFPDMELGGRAPDLVDQVEQGTVDIIWTAAAYTPDRFARTSVFTLPLVHKADPVATNLAMLDIYKKYLAVEFNGLKPLLLHVHQGHVLHMAHSDVRSLEDFVGKTLRAPGRSVGRWTVEALGASPTKKRHPKLPKALKAAKLDGALMSFALADAMGVAEVSRSHTILADDALFGTSIYLFLMNEKRYQSLPPDLRAVIDKASGRDLAIMAGKRWKKAGQDALAKAKADGHKIFVLEKSCGTRVQLALMKVLARYVKSLVGQGIAQDDAAALVQAAKAAVKAHN